MTKARSKSKPSAKAREKKRQSTNIFEELPLAPSDDDVSDKEAASELLKLPGSRNDDGTCYGGGPNDVYCSACKKAGYPNATPRAHCEATSGCAVSSCNKKDLSKTKLVSKSALN